MNDLPRKHLIDLIAKHGLPLCKDPRLCETLLNDYCSKHKQEIFVLICAMHEKVVDELLNSTPNLPASILIQRLAKQLHDNLGLEQTIATWSVVSWAMALKTIHLIDEPTHKLPTQYCIELENGLLITIFHKGMDVPCEKILKLDKSELCSKKYIFNWLISDRNLILQNYLCTYVVCCEDIQNEIELIFKIDLNGILNISSPYEHGNNVIKVTKLKELLPNLLSIQTQQKLGNIFLNGINIDQDYDESAKWYTKAATNGDADSQFNLALLYQQKKIEVIDEFACNSKQYNNTTTDKDEDEDDFDVDEYEKESEEDNIYDEYDPYESINREKAIYWHRKSAEQGHAKAQFCLSVLLNLRDFGKYGSIEAAKWCKLAAEQGHAEAQDYLGWLYSKGYGVKLSHKDSIKWYRRAAEQGIANSQYMLGLMYERGYEVTKDEEEAFLWYQKAAKQGHAIAQGNIAAMYFYGIGVAKNEDEGVKWYHYSAENGYDYAQYQLGMIYLEGFHVTEDEKEAIKWIGKAAEQGCTSAKIQLGFMSQKNESVDRESDETDKWYNH